MRKQKRRRAWATLSLMVIDATASSSLPMFPPPSAPMSAPGPSAREPWGNPHDIVFDDQPRTTAPQPRFQPLPHRQRHHHHRSQGAKSCASCREDVWHGHRPLGRAASLPSISRYVTTPFLLRPSMSPAPSSVCSPPPPSILNTLSSCVCPELARLVG